ncbi:MAG TPA: hypothetical protein VFP48_03755, partial [Steroidobacteraceae bacterium]|nr:hypothetical protein [Steroidobacteraceae bacterium]
THGVRLMKLDEGERLIGVESVDPEPPTSEVEGEVEGDESAPDEVAPTPDDGPGTGDPSAPPA